MFAIKSRFKDGTLFLDIQFRLSQSVHLIVLGRELYGYAHICICYASSLLAMHAGTLCSRGSPCWINTCCVECCLEFSLRILHGGSGSLTLTMPDPEPAQQQGLPLGIRTKSNSESTSTPRPIWWNERTKPGRMLDALELTFWAL